MSRFYGDLSGQAKTVATRRGNTNSGVEAHVRGWDIGVRIEAESDRQDRDTIRLTLTGGSNGNLSGETLLVIKMVDGQHVITFISDKIEETIK